MSRAARATAARPEEGLRLPVDRRAERAVLGACLASERAMGEAAEVLRPSDFQVPETREIAEALWDMHGNGSPVDLVTVCSYLGKRTGLVGGVGYVAALADELPDPGNVVAYCRAVRETALKRAVMDLGREALALSQGPGEADDDLERLANRLVQARDVGRDERSVELALAVVDEVDRIRAVTTGQRSERVVHTGIAALDAELGGMLAGDLVVVGARASVGKTAFAMGVALHAALESGLAVLYASLEMGRRKLAWRALSWLTSISVGRYKRALFGPPDAGSAMSDWQAMGTAQSRLRAARFHVADAGVRTPAELRSRCRARQLRAGLDLVIVDYLQLMSSGDRAGNRTEEVGQISRGLKLMATGLGVPVVALSQIRRTSGHGEGGGGAAEPTLSELRESGSIENDADMVILLHRSVKGDEVEVRRARGIIAKNRDGATGTVELTFEPRGCRFEGGA